MSKGFSVRGNAVRKANGAWTEFGILWASVLSEVAYKGEGLVYVDRVNELAGEGANGKRIGSQRAKSLLDRLWSCGTFELETRTDSKSANGESRWAVPGENFDEDYWAAAERGLLVGTDHVESGRIGAAYDAGRAMDLDGNLLHVFAAMHSRADLYGIYWGTLDETTVAVNKRTEIDPVTKKRTKAKPISNSTVKRAVRQLVMHGTWSRLGQCGLHNTAADDPVATPLWPSCDPPVTQLRPPRSVHWLHTGVRLGRDWVPGTRLVTPSRRTTRRLAARMSSTSRMAARRLSGGPPATRSLPPALALALALAARHRRTPTRTRAGPGLASTSGPWILPRSA